MTILSAFGLFTLTAMRELWYGAGGSNGFADLIG